VDALSFRSNTETPGSKPAWDMDVYLSLCLHTVIINVRKLGVVKFFPESFKVYLGTCYNCYIDELEVHGDNV